MAYTHKSQRILRAANIDKELHLEGILAPLLEAADPAVTHRMMRSRETGTWLTAVPNILNGTELSADEFQDSLQLRLGLNSNPLPRCYDRCQQ